VFEERELYNNSSIYAVYYPKKYEYYLGKNRYGSYNVRLPDDIFNVYLNYITKKFNPEIITIKTYDKLTNSEKSYLKLE
jgi:hypothetical protein